MRILRHLPNALTCGNLLCGTIGIIFISIHGGRDVAIAFVAAACAFDFLDGFAARLLKVSSPIGKELDSLADMVSFGCLPTIMLFFMSEPRPFPILVAAPFLVVICSALRLAKFNIDETQRDSFKGLPTPASALFITGLPHLPQSLRDASTHGLALALLTIAISLMMVSPFELFALKFKNFSWADNKIRFTFLALAVLLLLWLQAGAVSVIILLYIAISLVSRIFGKS